MFKQLPSRNHRSKGLKVKHVLQICVLLAICVWLIYQVKHSHERRGVFETKDGKVMKVQSNDEIQRIGRKDIPRITEISTDGEKNEEEDEEKEGEEEENKHEDDESEREDVRLVEPEEERGGGDDEIDEHETEKTEAESEHEEEAVDEDEETEEKEDKEDKEEKEEKEEEVSTEENHTESEENEDTHEKGHLEEEENEDAGKEGHTDPEENDDVDKDGHNKRKVKSDEQDHVAERTNTREAQEELYRADDASSEVTHNVQSVILETENSTMNHSNQIWGKVNFGQKDETKTSDIVDGLIKPEVQQREDVDSGISNATNSEQKKNEVNLTKPDEMTGNSTAVGGENSATLLPNGTETTLDSNLSQNGTVELPDHEELNLPGNSTVKLERVTDEKQLQEAAADANKFESVNTNTVESQSSYNTTLASSLATNDNDAIEAVKDDSQGVKAENSEKGGSDESSESHIYEGTGAIQHDPIDASDITSLAQEERESRTDLDTLPELRTEVQNTEDTVAE